MAKLCCALGVGVRDKFGDLNMTFIKIVEFYTSKWENTKASAGRVG